MKDHFYYVLSFCSILSLRYKPINIQRVIWNIFMKNSFTKANDISWVFRLQLIVVLFHQTYFPFYLNINGLVQERKDITENCGGGWLACISENLEYKKIAINCCFVSSNILSILFTLCEQILIPIVFLKPYILKVSFCLLLMSSSDTHVFFDNVQDCSYDEFSQGTTCFICLLNRIAIHIMYNCVVYMILLLPRHYFIYRKVDISAHDTFLESLIRYAQSRNRYLCWWTVSPRGYHPPNSQCFPTDMVYNIYLSLKFTVPS
jgi:hypothetical protein